MGATGSGTTYVTILECREDGTVWLQIQMPGGSLARGLYQTPEEAQGAAAPLERVVRGGWAQHEPEIGHLGGEIGNAAPMPPVMAGGGEESADEPPIRPGISQIHRILAHFLPIST